MPLRSEGGLSDHPRGSIGRVALSTGVEFVELDDAEAGRIYHFMNAECYARLEFFNLLPDDWSREQYWHDVGRLDDKSPSTEAADHALRVVEHIVALYTLVARDPLRPLAVNVDRFDGSRWVREVNRPGFRGGSVTWNQSRSGRVFQRSR